MYWMPRKNTIDNTVEEDFKKLSREWEELLAGETDVFFPLSLPKIFSFRASHNACSVNFEKSKPVVKIELKDRRDCTFCLFSHFTWNKSAFFFFFFLQLCDLCSWGCKDWMQIWQNWRWMSSIYTITIPIKQCLLPLVWHQFSEIKQILD